MSQSKEDILELGRSTIRAESAALEIAARRLDASFSAAVNLILSAPCKLIICGIGKSGHVGAKLASTFSSSGTPAIFLHAAEAIHGDLALLELGVTKECIRL